MVELLLVIAAIGILSGVTLSVINTPYQRRVAEDAVKRSNMEKIYMGIESFRTAEQRLPLCSGSDIYCTNPVSTDSALSTYISIWPAEPAGATYYYKCDPDCTSAASDFCIYAALSTNSDRHYKYYSATLGGGKIKECAGAAGSGTSCSTCNP